jgi:hypothetical protein
MFLDVGFAVFDHQKHTHSLSVSQNISNQQITDIND